MIIPLFSLSSCFSNRTLALDCAAGAGAGAGEGAGLPDENDATMREKREEEMEASSTAAAAAIQPPFSSQTSTSVFPFGGGFFDAADDKDSLGFLELLGLRDPHHPSPPFLFDHVPQRTPGPDPPRPAARGGEPTDGGNIPATPSSISTSSSAEAAAIKASTSSAEAAGDEQGKSGKT